MNKTYDCVICSDTQKSICVMLKCNHIFHIECLILWRLSYDTCPLCAKSIHILYNRYDYNYKYSITQEIFINNINNNKLYVNNVNSCDNFNNTNIEDVIENKIVEDNNTNIECVIDNIIVEDTNIECVIENKIVENNIIINTDCVIENINKIVEDNNTTNINDTTNTKNIDYIIEKNTNTLCKQQCVSIYNIIKVIAISCYAIYDFTIGVVILKCYNRCSEICEYIINIVSNNFDVYNYFECFCSCICSCIEQVISGIIYILYCIFSSPWFYLIIFVVVAGGVFNSI